MHSWKFTGWSADPASRVAVIGASGWIGMALVDQILAARPDVAAGRLRLFGSQSRQISIAGHDLQIEPLTSDVQLGGGRWLILHAGIIGADRVIDGDLGEVRRRNDALLEDVLALAGTASVERLVFVSSGAARRPEVGGPAKQAYAQMKLAHEAAVTAWSEATGDSVLIPRVFNLGGPYINHASAYAIGDFILQGARDGRIKIGSGGRVSRDFVHVFDMARGLLHMALDPHEPGAPFDVSLQRPVELDDLARAVFAALGQAPDIERPVPITGLDDVYGGEGDRFQRALQHYGEPPMTLERIVADTVDYLRQTGELAALTTEA